MDGDDDDSGGRGCEQMRDRRRRRSTMTATAAATDTAAVSLQQQSCVRRRVVPARRSCSAVTEREMMVAGAWQPSRQHSVTKRSSRIHRIPRSVQFSRLLERDQEKHVKGLKKNSRSAHSYDVFLGGSCNPTTWRKDLAVPYLQEAGLSFYNPQVDHWSQDLIEIEHAAKESATILFYVIDSQTRNVVSDIETANFAGHNNNLVLVIHPQDAVTGSIVAGEQITSKEAEDIREALTVLHEIASGQGILVFDNISLALSRVVQILKDKTHHIHGTGEDNTTYCKIRDAFNMFDTKVSGIINIFDARMAIRLLTNQNLSENEVLNLISEQEDYKAVGSNHQACFTFDQFHAIASKFLQLPDKRNRKNGFDIGRTCRPIVGRSLNLSQECTEVTRSSRTTDIYLAGESGDDIRWKEDVAIPMIKKSNLTYHAATRTDISLLLDARTLLFVIPNNSRSLATMTLAAYCIAKSCRMVLCIQNLSKDNCMVRGEKLTQTAINDYNRGRMYLADLASRERVPVFETTIDAVEAAIKKSL
ncbi:uncharacterized protein LOC112687330 isoform X2 [Sipha flava]|uniref:Uncharacterized protein LOC112687330 isoform X2 n=1 Tax=Sipha flava TaxID=143950 RepID=A0A8B8FXQ5_9HEMI|nr:uncharacterized protein LOC112687330 isoform X2 [Sipha flava]